MFYGGFVRLDHNLKGLVKCKLYHYFVHYRPIHYQRIRHLLALVPANSHLIVLIM